MSDDDERLFASLTPENLSPEVAAVIFATEWDDALNFWRTIAMSAGMTKEEWIGILNSDKKRLEGMVTLPHPMTIEKSKPFVELSDMLTLAQLARYVFERMPK